MIRSVRDRATFAALSRARRIRNGPVWLRHTTFAGDHPSGRHAAPRVAYAIPRAVGTAVERNRVRRRLRAAVAAHAAELEPGHAYLFGADRSVLHAPFPTIDRAVSELLRASSGVTP